MHYGISGSMRKAVDQSDRCSGGQPTSEEPSSYTASWLPRCGKHGLRPSTRPPRPPTVQTAHDKAFRWLGSSFISLKRQEAAARSGASTHRLNGIQKEPCMAQAAGLSLFVRLPSWDKHGYTFFTLALPVFPARRRSTARLSRSFWTLLQYALATLGPALAPTSTNGQAQDMRGLGVSRGGQRESATSVQESGWTQEKTHEIIRASCFLLSKWLHSSESAF